MDSPRKTGVVIMSITDKYRKLQLENNMLKKLLSFVCQQIELGSEANFESEEAQQLFTWWIENKPKENSNEKD